MCSVLAACSANTQKTVDCTAKPDGQVSVTLDTFDDESYDIGDRSAKGDWRDKISVYGRKDGTFGAVADGFGPVTSYDTVAASAGPYTLVTNLVTGSHVEVVPADTNNASVTITFYC